MDEEGQFHHKASKHSPSLIDTVVTSQFLRKSMQYNPGEGNNTDRSSGSPTHNNSTLKRHSQSFINNNDQPRKASSNQRNFNMPKLSLKHYNPTSQATNGH